MLPTYLPGEVLTGTHPWRRVRPGDVVVVADPREPQRMLLKRCLARDDASLVLGGDNPASSTDSREFGPVPAKSVRYVLWRGRPRRQS